MIDLKDPHFCVDKAIEAICNHFDCIYKFLGSCEQEISALFDSNLLTDEEVFYLRHLLVSCSSLSNHFYDSNYIIVKRLEESKK